MFLSRLTRKIEVDRQLKILARSIFERTGILVQVKDLKNLAMGLFSLTRDAGSGNRYYDLAQMLMSERAVAMSYSGLVSQIEGNPLGELLDRWNVLPLLHQILVRDEREFGPLSRKANDALMLELEQVIPEKWRELHSEANLVLSMTGKKKNSGLALF